MSVYRITKEKFEPLEVTSFEVEGIYERSEMQEKLLARPEILEKGLLILAKEYSDWEESNRRIDLLALDEKGRLVVVELKRSDQQSLMDLQARPLRRDGSQHDVGSDGCRSPGIYRAFPDGR